MIGLVVLLTLAGYMDIHSKRERENHFILNSSLPVRIGVITSSTESYDTYVHYFKNIIEEDINEYTRSMGRNYEFSFNIANANGEAKRHLELIQEMKEEGINIIIGGMWSSHAAASLSYCNYNDIILFSPSSSQPLLSIKNDNLFRLAPTDVKQSSALSRIMVSQGVNAVIIIQRGDTWADNVYDFFEKEFKLSGGEILARFRYPAEQTEFSRYLQSAEEVAEAAVAKYGEEHVAVEIISLKEVLGILNGIKEYPTLYSLDWYGSDNTVKLWDLIDNLPEEASHVKLFSPVPEAPITEKYLKLSDRFWNQTDQELDYSTACTYDLAMILVMSIIEANTTYAETLRPVIVEISGNYNGVTGNCALDIYGDRDKPCFGVYAYGVIEGIYGCWEVGFIRDLEEAIWYEPD